MTSDSPRSSDTLRSLLVFAMLTAALGLIVWLVLSHNDAETFDPQTSDHEIVDLLGWLPASDLAMRRYAAWSSEPGDPLSLSASIDQLAIESQPLAIARSTNWQRITGMDPSAVAGWASAPDAGLTVLQGSFDQATVISALDAHLYERSSYRGVPLWSAPPDLIEAKVVAGDDLRALAVLAIYGDRIVIGYNVDAVEAAIDAANGDGESLADQSIVQRAVTDWTAGLVVLDQRDLAIRCGLGRDWQKQDFTEPSGQRIMITWARGSIPTTTVRVEYEDDLFALAGQTELEEQWQSGYLVQIGMGVAVSDVATRQGVYVDGTFVVADLVQGRDNGWTRSGVVYLSGVCEHASRLIPATSPETRAPEASPSPMEQP